MKWSYISQWWQQNYSIWKLEETISKWYYLIQFYCNKSKILRTTKQSKAVLKWRYLTYNHTVWIPKLNLLGYIYACRLTPQPSGPWNQTTDYQLWLNSQRQTWHQTAATICNWIYFLLKITEYSWTTRGPLHSTAGAWKHEHAFMQLTNQQS